MTYWCINKREYSNTHVFIYSAGEVLPTTESKSLTIFSGNSYFFVSSWYIINTFTNMSWMCTSIWRYRHVLVVVTCNIMHPVTMKSSSRYWQIILTFSNLKSVNIRHWSARLLVYIRSDQLKNTFFQCNICKRYYIWFVWYL